MRHLRAGVGRAALALGLLGGLSACESGVRQDPLPIRSSTDDIVFSNVPLVRDRTVDESIMSSLELADYGVALRDTGLLKVLQRGGPYTVFAIPNEALEAAQSEAGGQLLAPEYHGWLRRLMAYTIVPGRYSEKRLRQMVARAHGSVVLSTIDRHDVLTVSVDPATGAPVLTDPQGHVNRIWLDSVPQSNGVLYATQSMLSPAGTQAASTNGFQRLAFDGVASFKNGGQRPLP